MAKKKISSGSKALYMSNSVLCSILSYFVIGIAWYFVDDKMRKSSLAKRHANQALFLILACLVGYVALWVFSHLPIIGDLLSNPMYVVTKFAFLFVWIFGIVQALFAQDKPMPFLGKFAEQLNL